MDHRHLLFVVVDVSLHFSTIVAHSSPCPVFGDPHQLSGLLFRLQRRKVKHVRWLNAEHMQLEERE